MAPPVRFLKLRGEGQPSRAQDNIDTTLRPMADAINQTPLMGTAPVWTPLALATGFANYGAVPGGGGVNFAAAAYYKDAFLRVWVKGVLICAAGCAAGTAVATFPLGLRIKEMQRKAVEGTGGTAQFISIAPTGVCSVEVAVAAGGSVDIDFSFLAER